MDSISLLSRHTVTYTKLKEGPPTESVYKREHICGIP